jgi:hypothetical protein
MGEAPHVPDLTRDELIDVVRLILEQPPTPRTDYYLQLFCRNVPHSAPSDLICYPEYYWPEGYQPTPVEIVEKALDSANIIRL